MTETVPLPVVDQTLNRHFATEMTVPTPGVDAMSAARFREAVELAARTMEELQSFVYIIGVESSDATASESWTTLAADKLVAYFSQKGQAATPIDRTLPLGNLTICQKPDNPDGQQDEPSRPELVHELRRLSGLTWEQLARALDVSRRTLHNWANGLPMSRSHEERVAKTLSVLWEIDRGSANDNRALLFEVAPQGETLLDLLARKDYETVLRRAGRVLEARKRRPVEHYAIPGPEPLPLSTLAEAREERVHQLPDEPDRWVSPSRFIKSERK